LFQPFSQADSAVARKYGGTGLGLYLVQQLATRMGGAVTVSSAPGRGSVFELDILAPLAPGSGWIEQDYPGAALPAAPDPVAPVGQGLRTPLVALHGHILLAEDGFDTRRLVAAFLTSLGLTHEAVENGRQAVELGVKGQFDLVLMDIRMPVMDGLQAIATLRGCGFDKPMVALTANQMQEDLERYTAAGFDASVGKPIDFTVLGETLARLLGQGGSVAPSAPVAAIDPIDAIDGLAEIRAAFRQSLPPRIVALSELVASAAWLDAAELAHQLRGAGGSFGFPGLSRCAKTLEIAARAGDGAAVRDALAELLALAELQGMAISAD
jgi:hypothetical protein